MKQKKSYVWCVRVKFEALQSVYWHSFSMQRQYDHSLINQIKQQQKHWEEKKWTKSNKSTIVAHGISVSILVYVVVVGERSISNEYSSDDELLKRISIAR